METDFCEYCNVFNELSEVEKIMSDAIGKIKDNFTEQVKNAIKEAGTARETVDSLKEEKERLQYEIERKKKELEKLEEEFQRKSTLDIPRMYRDRIVKEYTKNFVPGQEVWTISKKVEHKPCEYCSGIGKVSALVGEEKVEIRCPKCDGTKKVVTSIYEPKKSRISDVSLKLTFDGAGTHIWSCDCITLYGNDCWRTVRDIFETEEEAKKRADELNGSGRK